MSLHRYAESCGALASELKDSLSTNDQEALDKWFGEHAQEEWWAWRDKHAEIVASYVSETESRRARKKSYKPHQPLLTFAAIQHCLEAQALIQVSQTLEPGGSYRDMAAAAGQAYQRLMNTYIPDWPKDPGY